MMGVAGAVSSYPRAMNTGKLIVGVTAGILLAAAIIFGVYLATQPQDCALQRLEDPASVSSRC